jgi:hypothetical protein
MRGEIKFRNSFREVFFRPDDTTLTLSRKLAKKYGITVRLKLTTYDESGSQKSRSPLSRSKATVVLASLEGEFPYRKMEIPLVLECQTEVTTLSKSLHVRNFLRIVQRRS